MQGSLCNLVTLARAGNVSEPVLLEWQKWRHLVLVTVDHTMQYHLSTEYLYEISCCQSQATNMCSVYAGVITTCWHRSVENLFLYNFQFFCKFVAGAKLFFYS